MPDFENIRPYKDDEVSSVLASVLNDQEFLSSVIRFKFPNASGPVLKFLSWGLGRFLKFKTRDIVTVRDFQLQIESYMEHMLEKSTTEFTVSGFENLNLSKPCLFISNHRDIALDPAFVNWALHKNDQDTVRIAIGDNLLSKPWISALMRLNKSFIVQRGLKSPRDKLKASKQLSAYIKYSLEVEGEHVWIAQREGRAKDGRDLTNSALLSMIALNKDKTQSFGEYIQQLNMVPVSISYEYDPCDVMKAQELHTQETEGQYEKEDHEDAKSISQGIIGDKGRVHLHFGNPISEDFEDAKALAEALDEKILEGYRFHTSCLQAAEQLGHEVKWWKVRGLSKEQIQEEKGKFDRRLLDCPERLRKKMLSMYANPYLAKVIESP